MPGIFIFLLPFVVKIQAEEHGFYFQIKENTLLSEEIILWTGKAGSILSCSQICARREACKSVIFWANKRTCSLLGKTKKVAGEILKQDGSFYVEKVCHQLTSFQDSIVKLFSTLRGL